MRHRLKECRDCFELEKKELINSVSRDRAKHGPAFNTRGRTIKREGPSKGLEHENPKIGILQKSIDRSFKCTMTLFDGTTAMITIA